LVNNSWELLLESWKQLSKDSSFNVLSTIYKNIRQMVIKSQVCFYEKFNVIWKILMSSLSWIVSYRESVAANTRPLLLKLVPSIIKTFKNIFTPTVLKEFKTILSKDYLFDLYNILKEMLESINILEESYIKKNPINLIGEEKTIFEFIENLPNIFDTFELFSNYFKFLLNFLNFQRDNPRSDGITRRTLIIIKNLITSFNLHKEFKKQILNELYPILEELVALRFKNEVCEVLIENIKNIIESQPLWYEVGNYIVSISRYIIDHKLFAKEESKEVNHKFTEDKEIEDLAWKHIIHAVKVIIDIPKHLLDQLDKKIMDDVIKKSQDLDIILMNFILEALLPNSENLDRSLQQELIILIDSGCTAFNTSFSSISFKSTGDILDTFCISALVRLCNSEEERDSKFYPIKQKISNMTTPILVNRCKAIFYKYLADEKLSGTVPLPW